MSISARQPCLGVVQPEEKDGKIIANTLYTCPYCGNLAKVFYPSGYIKCLLAGKWRALQTSTNMEIPAGEECPVCHFSPPACADDVT